MSRGGREPIVVVVSPLPSWLAEIAGPAERGAAWATRAAVSIRVGRARFELDDAGVCHRAAAGARQRVSIAPAHRAELLSFVARLRWIVREETDAPRYSPSPRERRAAELADRLAALRHAADARAIEVDDPALEDVAAFLDCVAGRWERVLGRESEHPWLAPIFALVNGDPRASRELAPIPAAPVAIVAAAALERLGLLDAAWSALRAGADAVFGAQRGEVCVELARLSRARGDRDEAVQWARRAILADERGADRIRRASAELARCGALDDAHAALRALCERDPDDAEAALALAELLVWAERTDEARRWLERASLTGDELRLWRLRGALFAIEGRWADAMDALLRARRLSNDPEVTAWLSEVSLRTGALEDARSFADESRTKVQTAVHVLLMGALRGAGRRELAALVDQLGEPAETAAIIAEGGVDRALELLASFGGNRGELLTRRCARPGLGIELVPARPPDPGLASREASAETLRRIRSVPVAELEARFAELADAYPTSAHPLCYWGELLLWLGDYDRAIELFDRAAARDRVRWIYVGKAAAYLMRGEHERADAELAACARWFAPVAGATTQVYVGEAQRRRGELEAALSTLEAAVTAKPGRTSAWIDIALALDALGRAQEAEPITAGMIERHPRLFWDAWRAIAGEPAWPIPRTRDRELLEKTLEMMRGNRSSHTITYFDPDGAMRVAERADLELRTTLALHAPFVASELRARLLAGRQE